MIEILLATAFVLTDVTDSVGLTYTGASYGSAWCDVDGNGFPDIWAPNHHSADHLYRNFDGAFQLEVMPQIARDTHSASCADIDNDGDTDIYVVGGGASGRDTGQSPNLLYLNDGTGTFTEVGTQYDIDYTVGRGRNSVWFDKDDDGVIDVVIINAKRSDNTFPSKVFLGAANGFVEGPELNRWSRLYGTHIRVAGQRYFSFGAGSWPGVTYAYDASNFEQTTVPGLGKLKDIKSLVVVDWDGDLDDDYVACRDSSGVDWWEQRATGFVLAANDPARCTAFGVADFDNDGAIDVWPRSNEVSATVGDFDRDGRLDVYTTSGHPDPREGPSRMYRNTTVNDNHWIAVRLQGIASNRDGIGSRVIATTPDGKSQSRSTNVTKTRTQNQRLIHFGLGQNTSVNLTIAWPSGILQQLNTLPIDRYHTIVENGTGANIPPVASFTHTPGAEARVIDFDGTASFDSDGAISDWSWDFGDGANGTGSTTSHTYSGTGNFLVELTVTDDAGAENTVSANVSIADPSGNPLPVSVVAVGAISRQAENLIDVLVATGAQNLETSWRNDGSLATRYFTFDLGGTQSVRRVLIAPRADRSYEFDFTVGDVLQDGRVIGSAQDSCNVPVTATSAFPATLFACDVALPAGRYLTVQSAAASNWLRVFGVELYD